LRALNGESEWRRWSRVEFAAGEDIRAVTYGPENNCFTFFWGCAILNRQASLSVASFPPQMGLSRRRLLGSSNRGGASWSAFHATRTNRSN
jgi:hypothetical protein